MKLPLHIAKKLQQLLLPGETIASSGMQHSAVTKMQEDGLLQKKQISKTKSLLFISPNANVAAYLHNHFGVNNLAEYILQFENEEKSRAGNVVASGNSKLQPVRTFKGFLINSYDAINASINHQPVIIKPLSGSYTFIHAYESFVPDAAVTIVGIENPENFAAIEQQCYLFSGIQPLFVSRYPQSNDLVKWLAAIPNPYLHFGDLDFAGINIYQHEFKKQLGSKASFFVPPHTEALLQKFGNKELFNRQYNPLINYYENKEASIQQLLQLILQYKKVLEQEVFINQQ